ncbi:MAG: DNA polymerase I [Oscillospiraceae bacterium]|nr:DNA polymerase I [Oscillospiraceae bacterium]
MQKTVMAVDGDNLLHRAYHGIRPLSTADGLPTNAVYGFLSILHRLLKEYKPDGLCVAFDLPGPTFRHEMYDGYKAGRRPADEEFAAQLPLMREVLSALRVPIYASPGYEADDLLGTIGRVCAERGVRCVIVSSDRDTFQLISEAVAVAHVGNRETRLRNEENILEEYGLSPAQLIDLKALMGDASDRIPGVPGIGEKSALLLMREFGSIEAIYANLDAVPQKFRAKLEAGRESAALSRRLGEIRLDAPVGFEPQAALRQPPDRDALVSVFEKLEFRSLLDKWLTPGGESSFSPDKPALPEGVGRDVKAVWRAEMEAGQALSPYTDDMAVAAWMLQSPETNWEDMRARMEAEGVWKLYREVEMPLCRVLARMETGGVAVDRGKLSAFSAMLGERIARAQEQADALVGAGINLLSPKQLGELLFETLGLPHGKKNKTGWSTGADTLEGLKDAHPIVPVILETRMLHKLKSTYADGLLKASDAGGKVHSTFQMTATVTGRLSSTEPNLQNIPVRQELGAKLREMFVPSQPDWVFVDADYSQIELRVLAHIAEDEAMREAFAAGADIHAATAAQVFGVPLNGVTPAMRRSAKAVNFGIVYGISDFSLAADIGVSRAEAKAYITSYLDNYAGVRRYMAEVVENAKAAGYVSTLYGRRRYIPELRSRSYHIRSFGERAALNAPIQGAAADIIKAAMVAVSDRMEREGLQARLVLQVHDELIAECPREEAEQVKRLLTEEMEGVYALNPRLVADAHIGANWAEAKG